MKKISKDILFVCNDDKIWTRKYRSLRQIASDIYVYYDNSTDVGTIVEDLSCDGSFRVKDGPYLQVMNLQDAAAVINKVRGEEDALTIYWLLGLPWFNNPEL